MHSAVLPALGMALTLALAAPAQAEDIVVTGKSLKQTEADLRACLERKCPPDEDIKATLAHAENLFVSGDYKNSRATLKDSLGRNRKHGEAFPVPVSDLLRANGRISEQMGEAKDFQLSVLQGRRTDLQRCRATRTGCRPAPRGKLFAVAPGALLARPV